MNQTKYPLTPIQEENLRIRERDRKYMEEARKNEEAIRDLTTWGPRTAPVGTGA